MRLIAVLLATLPTFAIADPADTPKPGGGIVNRQTGAESWPYRGVPLDGVRQGVALAPPAPAAVATLPPSQKQIGDPKAPDSFSTR